MSKSPDLCDISRENYRSREPKW